MPGLMNRAAKAPASQQGGVSPEGQQQYDAVVTRGMQLLYSEQAMPKVLQAISQPNPMAGLGTVVGMLMKRLDDAATKAGQQVDPNVRAKAAKELLEQIAELAGPKGADIHKFTRRELETAYEIASSAYGRAGQQQPVPSAATPNPAAQTAPAPAGAPPPAQAHRGGLMRQAPAGAY